MTVIEVRLFFYSLPDEYEIGQCLPTKRGFAKEVKLQYLPLKAFADGSRPLNDYTINKVLPVMHKYGFQG